jgi:hypothetical protein
MKKLILLLLLIVSTYLLSYEDYASSGRVRHPRPAGHGFETAVWRRLGPRNQA